MSSYNIFRLYKPKFSQTNSSPYLEVHEIREFGWKITQLFTLFHKIPKYPIEKLDTLIEERIILYRYTGGICYFK
jgi:hypothetical protein